MRSAIIGLIVVAAITAARATPAPYGIGRAATAAELRAADISVAPTGAGLPIGKGTARDGANLYQALCAACHGPRGEGFGDYPPLVGGVGSLATTAPILTVGSYWPYATTAWDYIRRAMPYQAPGVLTADQVYALTAWLLEANGVVSSGTVLTEQTLPKVQMPNRNGFVSDPRPDVSPRR